MAFYRALIQPSVGARKETLYMAKRSARHRTWLESVPQVDDAQGQLILSLGTDRVLVGLTRRFKLVSPKSAALGYS